MPIDYGANSSRSSNTRKQVAILLCLLSFGLADLSAQTIAGDSTLPAVSRQEQLKLAIQNNQSITARQRDLAIAALTLLGRRDLRIDNITYPYDCSGTVIAALVLAGQDLRKPYAMASGNGVKRLHQLATRQNLIYDLPLPQIGDLVFWDNTWDVNGDKQWNDMLTHVGVVVGVDPNGTVEYVHLDYARGIVIGQMNLFNADRQFAKTDNLSRIEINTSMRMRSQEYLRPGVKLSGQLFRDFGRIYDYNDQTEITSAR